MGRGADAGVTKLRAPVVARDAGEPEPEVLIGAATKDILSSTIPDKAKVGHLPSGYQPRLFVFSLSTHRTSAPSYDTSEL